MSLELDTCGVFVVFVSFILNFFSYASVECEHIDNTCNGERWCWEVVNG